MTASDWNETEARKTMQRLFPRIESHFIESIQAQPQEWVTFRQRLEQHFPRLFGLLHNLYSSRYDFFFHLEELLISMARSWFARPPDLKALDASREQNPTWFHDHHMVGGVCYVDLFAQNLAGIRQQIAYFKELGLTYLHLMPLFKAPEGENDGGYAVSSYREVNPALGTMQELAELAGEFRKNNISLVVDLVFNHTSSEHIWAQKAKAGDPDFQQYYLIFPDRTEPDEYERTLREIFPDEHPGAFTYFPEMNKYVWTTFHSYQWDLNYANPEVFTRMAEEMLFLANTGVEVIRLDAVAFIWKQKGTNCENLPQAHMLIQAFNAVSRIAAPAMYFKSEAIVHPDEVARYIHMDECQISYNPLLMALLWNTLATRDVGLLRAALAERFKIPAGCAWVNYVRCHDDIGWTFSDEDAARLGINGYDHRKFLNAFYTGRFEGSFARGLPFQENPKTGDARISGTCASLAGLEKAIFEETEKEVEIAIRRIVLIHGIILTIGGIPLIYLGDEIGTLNDYSYRNDPAKARDSRWVHRPFTSPEKYQRRTDPNSMEGRVYSRLQRLIQVRKQTPAFSGQEMQVLQTGNPQVLGYVRTGEGQRVLCLANFSEEEQTINRNQLRLYALSYNFVELISEQTLPYDDLNLQPYQLILLKC